MQFHNVIINGGTFNHGGTFNNYVGFDSHNSSILRLLRQRGYIDYFSIHQKARLKDTCHWSMSNPAIQTWLTSDSESSDAPDNVSRLWLYGNPGTGKSVLAAFLIEQIQAKLDSQDQIVLSYFCKAAGSEKDKAVHVIMEFIRQCLLVEGRDQPYDVEVSTRFAKKLLAEREDYKFTLEEMDPYLSLFLRRFTKIWFIIDGIDECEDAISLIHTLGKLEVNNSKILLTSRKENHIFEHLHRWPSLQIGAEETTADDIQIFIDEQVRQLIMDRPVLKSHAIQLKDHLRKATGVMFLYARLRCETIREADPSTAAQVAEIINSLDGEISTLGSLYDNYLLQRLSNNNKYRNEVALRTLQWIKCSPSPVTSTFLLRALALDLNEGAISSASLDFNVRSTISKSLGVLVEWQETEAVCYATLMHYSLRDYLCHLVHNPPQWEELSVPYNSIVHEPAHLALLSTCCIVTSTPAVWNHLQGYHDSGDRRRKIGENRPKMLYNQLSREQPWILWEQRQRLNLDRHRVWRKKEAESAQSDLADIPEELESLEWVKNRRKQLRMIQTLESQNAVDVHQLIRVTTMRERDLMIYSFEYLAYHLVEAGKSGNMQITGAIDGLIPQMRLYAANIFSDIDPRQTSNALQSASLVDLAIALASFAETMDVLEQVVQYDPTNVYDWRWISFLLHFHMSRFPSNQGSNNTDAVWDPAILQSLKTNYPPFPLTLLFALVTAAIDDLRSVEYALFNYDENVSALVGVGILIQSLRHFERLLGQWMIFHSLEYIKPHLLSKDHLLFPKILTKDPIRPTTQPGGEPIFSHPTYSLLALLLCLVASAWSLNSLRMAILFSLSTQRNRYSFQLRSPFWAVLEKLPLLLPWPIAHWVISECSIYQLIFIIVVAGSFMTFATKALRSGLIPKNTKQSIIGFLVDRTLYESYFIVYLCCTDRSLATQLNMVLVYYILYELLISTVDPTGLFRARAYYCGAIITLLQTGQEDSSSLQIQSGFNS